MDPFHVPEHLKEYYAAAPRLTRAERNRLEVDGVRVLTLRTEPRGLRDEPQPAEVIDPDTYEHWTRLKHAEAAYRNAQLAEAIRSAQGQCDVCHGPRYGGAEITWHGQPIRACAECYLPLQTEARRRQLAARFDELLAP